MKLYDLLKQSYSDEEIALLSKRSVLSSTAVERDLTTSEREELRTVQAALKS